MTVRRWLAAVVLLLLVCPAAGDAGDDAEKTLLVHVTSLLDNHTDRTGLVFRVVAAGLREGKKVVLLFDAEGVGSLKMGRWFGGHSTPIDRVAIPERDRVEIAALLGATVEGIPDIYGSLLHFLKGRGVSVYVSGRALGLRGIGKDRYDHAAEVVTEERIVEVANEAGSYLSY